MNIHVPSLSEAVDDVKEKLMPSRMLFSIKDPGKTVPVPKHETILGLYRAQTRPAKAKHVFPNQETALAAIRNGKVKLSDEIEFGPPPKVLEA